MLPYIGNGKACPSICVTKLRTDKKIETVLYFRPLCLHAASFLLWSFASHFASYFRKTSNTSNSSAQCLLREQNILEEGVVGVTSVLRSGPKTNIKTVKHKCYHLVECIFCLRLVSLSTFPFGKGLSVPTYFSEGSKNLLRKLNLNFVCRLSVQCHASAFYILHQLTKLWKLWNSNGEQWHSRKQIQSSPFTLSHAL